MKRWNTPQQFANEIADLDRSYNTSKELNISQCNNVAKNVKNLYAKGGKPMVKEHLRSSLPSFPHDSQGLTVEQKDRVITIIDSLMFWHWLPWSKFRNNMVRIGAVK